MAGGLGGLGRRTKAETEWDKGDGGAGVGGASAIADQYGGGLLTEWNLEEEEGFRGGEEAKRRLLSFQEEQRSARKKRLEDTDSLSICSLAHRSCVPLCGHFGLIT